MNPYRMAPPPRWWAPKMKPRLVRMLRALRRRMRARDERLLQVDVHGTEHLQNALSENRGMLVTPNHSSHADPYTMYEVADRVGTPFYFMSTWHVFANRTPIGQHMLQWHGVFSVDREGADLRAFKQAVQIVQEQPQPLVIFPEGEIYHCNDRVTPFREGAAAIAISAARRAKRPIVAVPCAVKYRYLDDPTDELLVLMDELERHFHWRPKRHEPLHERIYRYGAAMMALKEIEFYGHATQGTLPERTGALAEHIMGKLEQRHDLSAGDSTIPERVKELRNRSLRKLQEEGLDDQQKRQVNDDLDDLFLVVQLFSYPGDYVAEQPTIERLAETLDKFEEDVLGKYSASIRATRRVTVRFGEPIEVLADRKRKSAARELTDALEGRVQEMLNAENNSPA